MKKNWLIGIAGLSLFLLVCGVVDKLANRDPIIKSIMADPPEIGIQDTTTVSVEAEDPDGDELTYNWDSSGEGRFLSSLGRAVKWIAPAYSGRFPLRVKVTDENNGKASATVTVDVRSDEQPVVTITRPVENEVIIGLGFYPIQVSVTYNWPIDRVDLFLGHDSLLFSDRTLPYEFTQWNVTALSGTILLVAKAFVAGKPWLYGVDSVHVNLEGTVPIPKK
jgi:hypothetical protein